MIGPQVVLDSDTLSELSRGHPRVIEKARAYLERHGRLTLSAITVFERLRGYEQAIRARKPFQAQLRQFRTLVAASRVLPVDGAVAASAATIWAQLPGRARHALGDILIAATAAVHEMPLATRNLRDFTRIASLEGIRLTLVDWTR